MSEDAGWNDDVNDEEFRSVQLVAGAEQEATTGLVDCRQWVRVYNKGIGTIEVGPQGDPKEILFPFQGVTYNHGPNNKVFFTALTGTPNVVITESG